MAATTTHAIATLANVARSTTVHHYNNVVDERDCEVVASAYFNMLACALILEHGRSDKICHRDSTPGQDHFTASLLDSWAEDSLLPKSIELQLISLTTGKGKGTDFCYLPEKEQLITGNPNVYELYAKNVYGTNILTAQPAGFIVFPEFANITPDFAHASFLEPMRPEDSGITYAGFVVVKGGTSEKTNDGGRHYFETLDDAPMHGELLAMYETFLSEQTSAAQNDSRSNKKGSRANSLFVSGRRQPYVLSKHFDLDKYNAFRKEYLEMYNDGAPTHNTPAPIHSELRWNSRLLNTGDLVVFDDRVPHRFVCRHPSERGEMVTSTVQHQGEPLVCAELSFMSTDGLSKQQFRDDQSAFITGTATLHPPRHVASNIKHGNRLENQVVRLISNQMSDNDGGANGDSGGCGGYKSYFCVNGDYYRLVKNPLLWALRGVSSNSENYFWDDYYTEMHAGQERISGTSLQMQY